MKCILVLIGDLMMSSEDNVSISLPSSSLSGSESGASQFCWRREGILILVAGKLISNEITSDFERPRTKIQNKITGSTTSAVVDKISARGEFIRSKMKGLVLGNERDPVLGLIR